MALIANTSRNTILGDNIRIADSSAARFKGLLGRRHLDPGEGLLITPSQGVHTVGMQFPIDVVFLGHDWRVIRVRQAMVPFRMTGIYFAASAVLELPAGVISQSLTAVGDQLSISSPNATGSIC